MRKLIVSQFVTLDGVMQGPGAADEDMDGGFVHGGWVKEQYVAGFADHFDALIARSDAVLLGRRTYVSHAQAFEPDVANDPFANLKKYVVSSTLKESLWRDTTIIPGNEDPMEAIRQLKMQPDGKDIMTDGSSQLVHAMFQPDLVDEVHLLIFPVVVGSGQTAKRVFANDGMLRNLELVDSKSTAEGVVIC